MTAMNPLNMAALTYVSLEMGLLLLDQSARKSLRPGPSSMHHLVTSQHSPLVVLPHLTQLHGPWFCFKLGRTGLVAMTEAWTRWVVVVWVFECLHSLNKLY